MWNSTSETQQKPHLHSLSYLNRRLPPDKVLLDPTDARFHTWNPSISPIKKGITDLGCIVAGQLHYNVRYRNFDSTVAYRNLLNSSKSLTVTLPQLVDLHSRDVLGVGSVQRVHYTEMGKIKDHNGTEQGSIETSTGDIWISELVGSDASTQSSKIKDQRKTSHLFASGECTRPIACPSSWTVTEARRLADNIKIWNCTDDKATVINPLPPRALSHALLRSLHVKLW